MTLPHLRGIIGVVVLLELIWNFQHFDTIYVLTGGGPAGATTTFAVAVYETAFKGFDLGQAGALGRAVDAAAAARRRVRACSATG